MAINPDEIAKARPACGIASQTSHEAHPCGCCFAAPCVVPHAHAHPLPRTPGVCGPLLPGLRRGGDPPVAGGPVPAAEHALLRGLAAHGASVSRVLLAAALRAFTCGARSWRGGGGVRRKAQDTPTFLGSTVQQPLTRLDWGYCAQGGDAIMQKLCSLQFKSCQHKARREEWFLPTDSVSACHATAVLTTSPCLCCPDQHVRRTAVAQRRHPGVCVWRPAAGGGDPAPEVRPGVPPHAGGRLLVCLQRHVPAQLRVKRAHASRVAQPIRHKTSHVLGWRLR